MKKRPYILVPFLLVLILSFTFFVSADEVLIKINFQPESFETPAGYLSDTGKIISGQAEYVYGWNKDHTEVVRERNQNQNKLIDTVAHFHSGGIWEIQLATGDYDVTVSIGDSFSATHTINVENINYWKDITLSSGQFLQVTKRVRVEDGRLTVDAGTSPEKQTRINYIEIKTADTSDNQAPVVEAGADQYVFLPQTSVDLNGTVTDDEKPVPKQLTYKWELIGGPGEAVFTDSTSGKTKVTFLTAGSYILELTASDGEKTASDNVTVILIDPEKPLSVNFQTRDVKTPFGFIADCGETFSVRNDYAYGWNKDHSGLVRKRNETEDQTLDTVCHFLKGGKWEAALPYGQYEVTVSIGDTFPSKYTINVEGINYWTDLDLTAGQYRQLTKIITVSDGLLTVDSGQSESKATRINYLKISKPGVNKAPLVDAGTDQAIFWPETNIKLTGTVSDDNLPASSDLTVFWEKVAGPGAVTFSDATKPETTVEFSAPGTYTLSLTANDSEKTTKDTVAITVIDSGKPIYINFQPKDADTPAGYLPDYGEKYFGKNGQEYGWKQDHTVLTRERNQNKDQRLDTICHLNADSVWEIALKNGDYEITVSVGDTFESTYTLEVEGLTLFDGQSIPANQNLTKKEKVHVADGKLTLTAAKSQNMATRINYLEITSQSPDVNKKPVLSAGKTQGLLLPKNALTLQGSVTDDSLPENIKTKWEVLSGPGTVIFENAQAAMTKATFGRSGTYTLQLSANDGEYTTTDTVEISVFDSSQPLLINFQPESSTVPSGYLPDNGKDFAYQNGYNYGWNQDHTAMVRKRNSNSDERLDTVCHFLNNGEWNIAVPNGIYEVMVGIGDSYQNTVTLNVEGINYWEQLQLEPGKHLNVKKQVIVEDNRLTLSSIEAANMDARTRINYLEISAVMDTESPKVTEFSLLSKTFTNSREVSLKAAGTDNTGIAGWLITLEPVQPDYQTLGWLCQQPDSYILPQVSGIYNLYLWVIDRQGNVSGEFTPITVELDYDPPVVTGSLTSSAITNKTLVNLSLEANDNKGVTGWLCTLTDQIPTDNDSGWMTEKPISYTLPDDNGKYTLFIWAKDGVGNISSPLVLEVELDKIPPEIIRFETKTQNTNKMLVPLVIEVANNANVTGWQVGCTSIISNQVILTPSQEWLTSAPTEFTLPDEDCSYKLFLWIKDKAGNLSYATYNVMLDRVAPEAPQVTGTTPTNNQTPTWNWNIPTDAVNIRYRLDDGDWVDIGGSNVTSFTPENNLSDGEHKLEVQAGDNVENWSVSGSFTIVIDSTPPEAPRVTGTANTTTATWNWNIPADAVNIRYRVDGRDWVVTDDIKVTSYAPTYLITGKHTLEVQAADNAGNWSKSGSSSVEIIPDFSLFGYAALNGSTVGGSNLGSLTVWEAVHTVAYIQHYLEFSHELKGMCIYIYGKLTSQDASGLNELILKGVHNISIIGVGENAELNGVCLKLKSAYNIVIRNLKIHNENGPCIIIEGPCSNIWIDHCEFSNNYMGAVETDPSLINITTNSEYMTLSWNYFHDCGKAVTIGANDPYNYYRKMTIHHNFFNNCRHKTLNYHYGTGHIFNNYFFNTCGINSANGARVLINSNCFENTANPIQTLDSSNPGLWDVKNNLFMDCLGNQPETSSCKFTPEYVYIPRLIPVEDVKNAVTRYSGTGIVN